MRVEAADVAEWDPYEREGGFAELFGTKPSFPYVLGTGGAGIVAAVGAKVTGLKVGDRVYASSVINPKGGFYAQYCAVKGDIVSHIPGNLTTEQAAAMSSDALTGLRGLADIIDLKSGETIMIFGAGGGIGHLAVQLAKRMGARVFAVASGEDGVDLAKRLGADAVVNGRKDDVVAAARAFAPAGLDAALMTAGGDAANRALAALPRQPPWLGPPHPRRQHPRTQLLQSLPRRRPLRRLLRPPLTRRTTHLHRRSPTPRHGALL